MKSITLEEHISFFALTNTLPTEAQKHFSKSTSRSNLEILLDDITTHRLKSMDDNGIRMQILSVIGKGADLLDSTKGPAFAQAYNDEIATRIAGHTERFKAFAHLPTTHPMAAADELERTVKSYQFCGALINGTTNGEFLDNVNYAPILERAERLDVPIYLHPNIPPKAVLDAYYSNLPKEAGNILAIAGWGWHSETALHLLRLILSGTLDQYPRLKLIIGHMGEMLPMMMARCDQVLGIDRVGNNQRSITQTIQEQVFITSSGMFSLPPLQLAIETLGIDRIMYSVDYPYSTNEMGTAYLNSLNLSPLDFDKLTYLNASKLLKIS